MVTNIGRTLTTTNDHEAPMEIEGNLGTHMRGQWRTKSKPYVETKDIKQANALVRGKYTLGKNQPPKPDTVANTSAPLA
jgi:hypothetical protein